MPLTHATATPHFILGGARSGKSAYAESLVTTYQPPYAYIATAQALDDEMKDRIRNHQQRRGLSWETVEAPIFLPEAIMSFKSRGMPVLVDCLTLWLSNLLLTESSDSPQQSVHALCASIRDADFPLFIVSNEVGAGIVPENPLARHFRDLAGFTNQLVAAASRAVTLVVAGLPLPLK